MWEQLPALDQARSEVRLVSGWDGRIWVVGGVTFGLTPLTSTERMQTRFCRADSNGDGEVDIDDLLNVLAAWDACP
jgi:hypothetical protein